MSFWRNCQNMAASEVVNLTTSSDKKNHQSDNVSVSVKTHRCWLCSLVHLNRLHPANYFSNISWNVTKLEWKRFLLPCSPILAFRGAPEVRRALSRRLGEHHGVILLLWRRWMVHHVAQRLCGKRAHQLLKRGLIQLVLHSEVAEGLPGRLVALDLHRVGLHRRIVADWTRCHHGDALKQPTLTTVLKKKT